MESSAPWRRNGERENEDALVSLMEVTTLCALPMALNAAIRLRVMDILANGDGRPSAEAGGCHFLSAAQIASHPLFPALSPTTNIHSASTTLDRILRLLAGHGLLDSRLRLAELDPLYPTIVQDSCNSYSLNSISRYLAQPTNGTPEGCFAPFVSLILGPVYMPCLNELQGAVQDGSVSPFTKVHGVKLFDYAQLDTRFNTLFNQGMIAHTKLFMQSLLRIYVGFQEISSLVDVGGGLGVCASMIASQHPGIKTINFDLPHVIANAPRYPGVEHASGDMFEAIPKANAIFMKWILHEWSDSDCVKIIQNCYKALPPNGKVIIVDTILPLGVDHDIKARVGYNIDLLLLALIDGGRGRTKKEFEKIARAGGFMNINYASQIHGITIVELFKESNGSIS